MKLALSLYNLAMVFLPREFRERHREEMLDTFERRWKSGSSGVARVGVLSREIAALVPAGIGAFADVLQPTIEPLLSLLPGHTPGRPAEPTGRGRTTAMRQLRAYPELEGMNWDTSWQVWVAAWPAIARDPAIRALRLLTMGSIMIGAAGSAMGTAVLIGERVATAPWLVLLVPLAPAAGVFLLGAPVARLTRPAIMARVRPYLAHAIDGAELTL